MKITLIALISLLITVNLCLAVTSDGDSEKIHLRKAYKPNLLKEGDGRDLIDLKESDDDSSTPDEETEDVITTKPTTAKPTTDNDTPDPDATSEETTTTPITTTTPATTTTTNETPESGETVEETTTTPAITTLATTDPDATSEEGSTAPTTTPKPIECNYPPKKIYIRKDGITNVETRNKIDGISYSSKTLGLCKVNHTTGVITINTTQITNGVVKCEVECQLENNKLKGYYYYQVAEYKPTLDKKLTTFPMKIYPDEEFNATMILTYPTILDLSPEESKKEQLELKISVNTPGYSLSNEDSELSKTSNISFPYTNLNVTTENEENNTLSFKFSDENHEFIYEDVKIASREEATACPIDQRDGMGVCCERKDVEGGAMCKNLTTIIPFQKDVDDDLYNAYVKLIDVMLNITNYIYSVVLDPNNKQMLYIPMNIEMRQARLRQLEDIKLDDYEFAKSLLSVLDATNEAEVEEKIKLLPPEVQQQLQQANIKENIKNAVDNVVKEAEKTGNSIDYSVGISNDFAVDIQKIAPTETPKEEKKPWAEEYWYVILIIVLVVVIILAIVGVVAYMNISKSMKQSKQQKAEKIMETTVPIEQVKQENKITEDDIYKPFSYEVIMEGYLLKEGRDRIVDKYQRRYCVLYFEPAMFRIYDSMVPSYYGKVYIDEKQSIPLSCYSGIEYSDGANDFTLILKINESNLKTFEPGEVERRVHFKVEGENVDHIAKKWVECFRDFKNQKPKTGEAWTQPVLMDNAEGRYATTTESQSYDRNMTALERAQQRRKEIKKMTAKHPY